MPLKAEILFAPSELRYDLPANQINSVQMPDLRNTTYKDGYRKKRNSLGTRLGTIQPLSGPVVGGFYYVRFAGTSFLVMATTDDLYKFNTTSNIWEVISRSTVLDACDTGWTAGSGDTLVHDTSDKMIGTASMKLTLEDVRADDDNLAYKDISSSDITANDSIGFWMKASTALAAGDVKIVISESNHASGEQTGTFLEVDCPILVADTWTFVRSAETLTNYDAVISVSLFGGAALASGLIIRVDDIRGYSQLTGDDDDFMSFDTIRDVGETDQWLVATNGVDELIKWTGAGVATNLITDFPAGVTSLTAKQLLQFKSHIHLFDVSENGNRYPTRVRWSNTALPADFINGNASFQDLVSDDWIKRALLLGPDTVVVLKSKSIWIGYATEDVDVFKYELQVPGLGVMAGRTAQAIKGSIIFLGWDDVYLFSGTNYVSVGKPIRTQLFAGFNITQVDRAFGMIVDDDNEYWLFCPMNGSTYCNTAFVYNYELGQWTGRHEFTLPISSTVEYQRQSSTTIGDLVGTIGEQNWKFGDKIGFLGAPVSMLGDNDGFVYQYDMNLYNDDPGNRDLAVDGWFMTKDFMQSGLLGRQYIQRLDIFGQAPGVITVDYSLNQGATWTSLGDVTITGPYTPSQIYIGVDCKVIRFRFRNNVSTGRFSFREARMYWKPTGSRLV